VAKLTKHSLSDRTDRHSVRRPDNHQIFFNPPYDLKCLIRRGRGAFSSDACAII
jgi:hypothetical protein